MQTLIAITLLDSQISTTNCRYIDTDIAQMYVDLMNTLLRVEGAVRDLGWKMVQPSEVIKFNPTDVTVLTRERVLETVAAALNKFIPAEIDCVLTWANEQAAA